MIILTDSQKASMLAESLGHGMGRYLGRLYLADPERLSQDFDRARAGKAGLLENLRDISDGISDEVDAPTADERTLVEAAGHLIFLAFAELDTNSMRDTFSAWAARERASIISRALDVVAARLQARVESALMQVPLDRMMLRQRLVTGYTVQEALNFGPEGWNIPKDLQEWGITDLDLAQIVREEVGL